MSYNVVIASAINLWPFQDLAGPAVDVIGSSPLTASGGLVFGVPGPRAWLARGISVPVDGATLSTLGIPGAVGLVGYTLGFWVRANTLVSGFYRILTAAASSPLFVSGTVFQTSPPWGDFFSTLSAVSGNWDYVTIGRSVDGLSSWVSVNDLRESFVSTAGPMAGLPLSLGFADSPPVRSFAQMALWPRPLSLVEVDMIMEGPSVLGPPRRVRGSSRGRRIGNVR